MKQDKDLQQVAEELCTFSNLPQVQSITYQQLVSVLSAHLNQLLKNDFAALVQLLYKMDIAEDKLRYHLQQNKQEMAGILIAQLMIERQLQKIEARRASTNTHDIPEAEKW